MKCANMNCGMPAAGTAVVEPVPGVALMVNLCQLCTAKLLPSLGSESEPAAERGERAPAQLGPPRGGATIG